MLGVGVVGSLDGAVLHAMLQWHNFYVHTTLEWRLFIDGVFHLVTAGVIFAGALALWRQRRLFSGARADPLALAAGVWLGMGAFNLYDGIIQHKVLRLHPVREGVDNILPYDATFIAVAMLFLLTGWLLWRRVAAREPGRT